jgi:hypothetical protein
MSGKSTNARNLTSDSRQRRSNLRGALLTLMAQISKCFKVALCDLTKLVTLAVSRFDRLPDCSARRAIKNGEHSLLQVRRSSSCANKFRAGHPIFRFGQFS